MNEVKNKISKFYSDYLTDEEKSSLESLNEKELRILVNKIWDRVIPNIYKPGEEFKLFVRTDITMFLLFCDIENCIDEVFKSRFGTYQLLSSKDFSNVIIGTSGFVGKIDWIDAKELLLPMEVNGRTTISGKFIVQGIYSVNCGEKEINSEYSYTKTEADVLNLPFYDINAREYNSTIQLDLNHMVVEVVCRYVLDKGWGLDIELRDKLVKDANKKIKSIYAGYQADTDLFFAECYKYLDGLSGIYMNK